MSSKYATKSFYQSIIQIQVSGLTITFIESEGVGRLITFAGGIGCEFELFSIISFSGSFSSLAQASKASLNNESKVAPGNLCLATSRKVSGKDSDAASFNAGLFYLCSCSS